NALVCWKYVTSFLKRDWTLADYPVRIRHFDIDPTKSYGRVKPVPVAAQIVNWGLMSGHGDTEAEALANLAENFDSRKAKGEPFPRPGRGLPIEFASTDRIGRHSRLAADFVEKILELNCSECFVSDESSLWHFHAQEDNRELHEKIVRIYGV